MQIGNGPGSWPGGTPSIQDQPACTGGRNLTVRFGALGNADMQEAYALNEDGKKLASP